MFTLSPRQFQTRLLKWFDTFGRKHLPWQQDKTPYRVWVSEIMLQQTQVATVIPYFEKFMHAFPDLPALANAHEDDVLHLWAGLGYYSRARNLHRAAKIILKNYHGEMPSSVDELKSLPGIGPSTAGAIAALAFYLPATILDGNVKRVLSRLHGITEPINDKQTEDRLWSLAISYTPKQRTADYTQAMMDLGATLCTRANPQCGACPFVKQCLAYQQDIVAVIPAKKAARRLPVREATMLVFQHKQNILLQKRPDRGIWGGLWSLPETEGKANKSVIKKLCQEQFDATPEQIQSLAAFRHTFTHFHLDIYPVIVHLKQLPEKPLERGRQIWYNLAKPKPLGLPKPVQTIMSKLP